MKIISLIFTIYMIINLSSCSNNSKKTSQQKEEEQIYKMVEDLKDLKQYTKKHKNEILDRLKSDNPKDRSLAIESITFLKIKEAVPQLMNMHKNDTNERVRWASLWAISELGDKDIAVPLLLEALKSNDVKNRRSAAIKLAKYKNKEGISALIEILDSGNEDEEIIAYNQLESFTGKNFGKITIMNKPGLIPYNLIDPEKKKEVFARWKQWWREESGSFEFGGK